VVNLVRVRNVVLFIVGLLLALITYPVAWFVSIGLAYVMAILGIVFGGYIIVKRASKTDIVLGAILLIFAILSLGITVATHTVILGIQEALKTKNITATIGERVVAGDWAITVLKMDTPDYVKEGDSYYRTPNGSKIVVIWLKIENLGKELESPGLWDLTLVTDVGKGYDRTFIPGDYIWDVTEDIKSKAIEVKSLDLTTKLASGASTEGCIYFKIPANENPKELRYKVVGGYSVIVKLS